MKPFLFVFAGGGLGAVFRYGLLRLTESSTRGLVFPWTIFAINISGSFLLGMLMAFATPASPSSNWRLFLATGVLGGYTTFSTFSADTLALLQAQRPGPAVANALLSVLFGVAFAFLGWWLATKWKS